MSSDQAPTPRKPPPSSSPSSKKNQRYPSKTCKYAGVTFRATREKYQARIYKGNKEYNLGLYEVAADAALAYDVAHRLVKKVTAEQDNEIMTKLEAYEADVLSPNWLDVTDEDTDAANRGLDPEKINFLRPRDYLAEREREIQESRDADTAKHTTCLKLDDIRDIIRKEAIRVVRIIVGAIDGRRRKGKKGLKDGKRRKLSDFGMGPGYMPRNNVATTVWVPHSDAYYQSTGLGRPVPNPSRAPQREHPFGPTPVVPVGPMARHMMMPPHSQAFARGANDNIDTTVYQDNVSSRKHASGGDNGNNGTFSEDTHQAGNVTAKASSAIAGDFHPAGMPAYYGMGYYPSGMTGQGPGMGQSNMYAVTPEEYHRMMYAGRSMGPNAGMHNATGMHNNMMVADNPPSFNQGNLYSNGFSDIKKEESETATQSHDDTIPMGSGQFGNQHMQPMFQPGSFPTSAATKYQSPWAYHQGPQYGVGAPTPGYGQYGIASGPPMGAYPPSNSSTNGGGYQHSINDMSHLLGSSTSQPQQYQGNHPDGGPMRKL